MQVFPALSRIEGAWELGGVVEQRQDPLSWFVSAGAARELSA